MSEKLFIHMRCSLFILSILFIAGSSVAQTSIPGTINSAGNTHTENDMIFEWSIGELALVETMINNKGIITNGLLQPVLPIHMITEAFIVSPTNILTFNGDGINDVWVIKDLDKYSENEVTIFDRAGRVVFTTKNYQNTWNGTLADIPLAEDTYYYVITLKKDGQKGVVKGFITIVK